MSDGMGCSNASNPSTYDADWLIDSTESMFCLLDLIVSQFPRVSFC